MGSTSIVLQSSILLVYYLCPICLGDYMEKIIVLEIVMKKSVVSEGYPGFPGITVGRIPRPVNKKLEGSEVTWVFCVRHNGLNDKLVAV